MSELEEIQARVINLLVALCAEEWRFTSAMEIAKHAAYQHADDPDRAKAEALEALRGFEARLAGDGR